jgi:predicted ATP-dependent serine protease
MTFHCKDCSYRGKNSGQRGECPACGSYNIVQDFNPIKERSKSGKWRLVLLVLLWGYLITAILWKLSE